MSKVVLAVSIAQAMFSVIDAIQASRHIYKQTVDFMDAMQIDSGLTGAAKKAAVMDKMREIILGENESWERWSLALSSFIDEIKASYNKFKSLFPKLA